MSNKIVPEIYRSVIDEVVQAIKSEFDEYGVSEDILADLQSRWEQKVMASNVADFDSTNSPSQNGPGGPQAGVKSDSVPPNQNNNNPSFPQIMGYSPATLPYLPGPPGSSQVKQEPADARFVLQNLPGPQLGLPQFGGGVGPSTSGARPGPSQHRRIPQVDGTADEGASEEEEEDGSRSQQARYAPRSTHPSLPTPVAPSIAKAENVADSEAINSDLDDSDTADDEDAEDGGDAATDIVFCTYDKVARVKNKWKCVLKDGMVHVNGKDYLFAKCNGEFEW